MEKRGKTLLPQFLGLYRLTVENVETYLIVTRNIFGKRYPIHSKYDLKVEIIRVDQTNQLFAYFVQGSTVQRSASDKEKVDFIFYKIIDSLSNFVF